MAKKITSQKDLKELALFYCSKRETSRSKLGQYLARKCRDQDLEDPLLVQQWIETILEEFEHMKIIDDERFGGMIAREYERRGKGKRYVEQKLMERGISKEKFTYSSESEAEEARALEVGAKFWERLLKTKIKIPKSQARNKNAEQYLREQKLMQKLVTAGYSFDLIKRILPRLTK